MIVNRWLPVGGLGANDAVEAFKPHAGWPPIKGAGWVLLPCRSQVPLAKTAGGVAILFKYFCNCGGLWWNRTVVGGEAVGDFRDTAHVYAVMIAPRQQRSASRRTQGCGVKLVVLQTCRSNLVDTWGRDGPAKGATGTKADIIQHHQQYVRRARRLLVQWQRTRSRVFKQPLDVAVERSRGLRYIAHNIL